MSPQRDEQVSAFCKLLTESNGNAKAAGPGCCEALSVLPLARGELKVKQKIGKGAFATVYAGTYAAGTGSEEEEVAVKVLHSTKDSKAAYQFFEEGIVTSQIVHCKNAVHCKGMGMLSGAQLGLPNKESQHPFMLQPLAHQSLHQLLMKQVTTQRRMYTWGEALHWMSNIAEALAFLSGWEPMIIHRDLKPGNVLLTRTAGGPGHTASLADFGMVRQVLDPNKPLTEEVLRAQRQNVYLDEAQHQRLAQAHRIRFTSQKSSSLGLLPLLGQWSNRADPPDISSDTGGMDLKAVESTNLASMDSAVLTDASATCRPLHRDSKLSGRGSSWLQTAPSQPDTPLLSVQSLPATLTAENDTDLNLTGQTGSVLYMAPEVCCHKPYGPKADVYSLGCVLYETLNYFPFILEAAPSGHKSMLEAYSRKMVRGWRPDLSELPPPLQRLVSRCWHQDSKKRPTPAALVLELQALALHPDVLAHDAKIKPVGESSGGHMCGCVIT